MSNGTNPACRWNDKIYYDGDHWKENGVDFFCAKSSHESHRVRSGCYVESRRVKCTGAITGKFIFGYQSIHGGLTPYGRKENCLYQGTYFYHYFMDKLTCAWVKHMEIFHVVYSPFVEKFE